MLTRTGGRQSRSCPHVPSAARNSHPQTAQPGQPRCHQRTPFFFFNDTATTEIYTLSLHDAPPNLLLYTKDSLDITRYRRVSAGDRDLNLIHSDRKSTRLNSSHLVISYAVFCLK